MFSTPTTTIPLSPQQQSGPGSAIRFPRRPKLNVSGSSNDCSREQVPTGQPAPLGARAKLPAAKDAFIAGMIYTLSRRLLPGAPYIPGIAGVTEPQRTESGRWKLDECLRFATELAARKARRRMWEGLGEEMARAGWFEA